MADGEIYMDPLVSVVVPIYNVEQYLEKCIESIINQSYKNLEIILVDDGAKDRCPQICDKYGEMDNRIKIIHKKNGGAAKARKVGAASAGGEYITFIDGDDWIEKDMIARMIQKQTDFHADVVICNFCRDQKYNISYEEMFFPEGFYDKFLLQTKVYPQMVYSGTFGKFGITPSMWGKIFCIALLKKVIADAPGNVSLGDDATVLYPLMLQAKQCYIIHDPLYHYRVNENSMTLSYNKTQTRDTINLINYLRKKFVVYKNYNLQEQLVAYQLFITMRNIVNIGEAGFRKGYGNRIKDLKTYLNRTSFYDTIKQNHIKNIEVSKKIKLGIWILKIHCPGLLAFIYCINNVWRRQRYN